MLFLFWAAALLFEIHSAVSGNYIPICFIDLAVLTKFCGLSSSRLRLGLSIDNSQLKDCLFILQTECIMTDSVMSKAATMEIPINSNGDTGALAEDDSLEQVGDTWLTMFMWHFEMALHSQQNTVYNLLLKIHQTQHSLYVQDLLNILCTTWLFFECCFIWYKLIALMEYPDSISRKVVFSFSTWVIKGSGIDCDISRCEDFVAVVLA